MIYKVIFDQEIKNNVSLLFLLDCMKNKSIIQVLYIFIHKVNVNITRKKL
jgi:hypothetical protein